MCHTRNIAYHATLGLFLFSFYEWLSYDCFFYTKLDASERSVF